MATGSNYPGSLDSWPDKATGDNLTVADVNQRTDAIEGLESGPIRPNDGTAALPAFTFRTSNTTGMYLSAADAVSFSTAGVRRGGFSATGQFDLVAAVTHTLAGTFAGTYTLGGTVTLTTPNVETSLTSPVIYGGSLAGSDLLLQATSNGSPSGAVITLRGTSIIVASAAGATNLSFIPSTIDSQSLSFADINVGNNIGGSQIILGRNSNAGAEGPAPGTINFVQANAGDSYIWADNAGLIRTHTVRPTGSTGTPTTSITAGTVLGDQTSWWEEKNVIGETQLLPVDALAQILSTKIYDYRFKEVSYEVPETDKRRPDKSPLFTGLVGYDRSDWFLKNVGRQQTPVLNEAQIFGYLIQAIKALEARIATLLEAPPR